MSRAKLNKPTIMTMVETEFFDILSKTNDQYGLGYTSILYRLGLRGYRDYDERDIRLWVEKWNTMKYINIVPTYRIYYIKHIFKRILIDSKYVGAKANKVVDNLKCALVDYKTFFKVYGEVNTTNQINIADELMEVE